MPGDEVIDQEEPEAEEPEVPESPVAVQGSAKVRKPLSNIAVELTEDELGSKGAQKFLVGEISRLETENSELRTFRDDFHDRDKDCAKYEVRLRKNTMLEILYTGAVAIGVALLGLTQTVSGYGPTTTLIVLGVALIGLALLAKWKGA